MVRIFDSHAHLIADDAVRYPPAPVGETLKPGDLDNPMTAERLIREMDATHVERAVVVQRASIYGHDNSYICDSVAKYPERLVAVCAIDADSTKGPDQVRHWVEERGAAGVRVMELVRGSDISWLYSPLTMATWRAVNRMKVPFCVHFFPWNRVAGLTALKTILDELPDTILVVDHFSNMNAKAGPPDYGMDDLFLALTRFPNVYTKFTTVPLGRLEEEGIDAAPIIARVVKTFGANRVMWGSDITQSKGSYEYMVKLGHRATAALSDAEREQVLYGATKAVYGHR